MRNTEDDSVLNMKTQADYNILSIPEDKKNEIKSMKVTLTLRKKSDYNVKLPIAPFLDTDSLKLYKNTTEGGELTKDNTNSTATDFVYYVNCTKNDFTGNIYHIPINFAVYTGDNDNFEDKTYGDENSTHLYYSNYMVKVNVELYDGLNATGTKITGSDANNHIIYTNAKMYYDIVPNS